MSCSTETISVSALYRMYEDNILVKPKIQRSMCWEYKHCEDKTNCEDFIQFIKSTRNIINPLIFMEKEHDGKRRLFTIDGNNRLNAIINFIKKPLDLLTDVFEGKNLTPECVEILKTQSLTYIFDNNIDDIFIDLDKMDVLNECYGKFLKIEVIKSYREIKRILQDYNFLDISVPIIKFDNINEMRMIEIYSGLNRNGIKLSEQDILASTCSILQYKPSDIPEYFDNLMNLINEYYKSVNENELFKIDNITNATLNLYEILLSLNIDICKKYNFLVKGREASQKYDTTFEWYNYVFGGFGNSKGSVVDFIKNTYTILDCINDISLDIYGQKINFPLAGNYKIGLPRTFVSVMYVYMYKKMEEGIIPEYVYKIVKSCILYYEIWSILPTTNDESKKIKAAFRSKDAIKIVLMDKKQKIESIDTITPCTGEEIHSLVKHILGNPIEASEAPRMRRKPNKLYCMLLVSYFEDASDCEVEHIIPFSSRWKNCKLDIDRLGNLTLLNKTLNAKRGNGRVTDTFIKQNNLLSYPCENEYNKVVDDRGNIKSKQEYNLMCEIRETKYVDKFLKKHF